jgi:uncharacterized protein (TIGR02099 family)
MMRLRRTLEALAWALFFTLAVAVLVLRYGLLPQIERYRPQIVERVAATVGQPVKIGRIEAEWPGLRPQINLADVRIYDAQGREALVLPSVENILSWRSLLRGELGLHALRIEGPRLSVRRDAGGALYVAGAKLAAEGAEHGFGEWLLGQAQIEVRGAQIEWLDEQRGAPPLVLSVRNLQLKNEDGRHLLGLSARPPAALGSSLEVRAELAPGAGWSGRVYAELGYTDLAAWRQWLDYPVELQRGQGALRIWAALEASRMREVNAELSLADVGARLGAELPELELAALSGRLRARALAEGYAVEVSRLLMTPQDGSALQPLDFQFTWNAGAENGVVAAQALELAPLARFAEALPLPAELRRFAAEMQPRGRLSDARFEWQGAGTAPTRYRMRAAFAELGMKPRDAIPGFAGLAGTLEASESGGRLDLQSHDAQLELPRVFGEPRLAFDALSGELLWRREGEATTVEVPTLTFSNADLSGNAFGSYAYGGEGPGAIDLSAVFNRADARHLARYLPLGGLMGDKPREWLVKAIVAGQASDVELRLRGDLRDFPFADPAKGTFRVSARVRNGELLYASGWPAIQDIEGDLVFERSRMEISGRSGTVLGAKLHDVRVSIATIGAPGAHVLVSGEAQGPSAEFLRFIASSPLQASAGRFTAPMSASGDGRLRLKLDLPLADLRSTKVAGEYELGGGDLLLTAALPPLRQARGRLAFTESSFAVRQVRASIFGGAVTINGGTRAAGVMEFVARGDAQAGALGALLDHPLRRYLDGSTSYVANVSLRDGLQRVVVESSLRGIASTLPPPLEKTPGEARALRVEFVPADGGKRERISVALARTLAAEMHRSREGDAMKLQRAALWLTPGAGQSVRIPDAGLLVYGSLAALDADRWRALDAGDGGAGLPVSVELRIGRLDIHGRQVHNLALKAASDAAGWSAVVDADEIAGRLSYQAKDSGHLIARLLHLSVPRSSAEARPGEASALSAKPADLPDVDFVAERFSLRGKELGRVELAARRDGADWQVDKLSAVSPEATLRASGRWRGAVAPSTELEFTLDAADGGRFLERLGYRGMVSGAKSRLDGSLRWKGDPSALDYASLSGELKMSAEEGEFLEIEPGLGKLISLMNLQALPRRITLDFRDVFSKGFRFDRIDAASGLDNGVMQLREFRMRGPAAEVAMTGDVDLARETQNLKVRVVPSLGGSASTVVGIVNPVAGVAAALAQQLLKNPLGQIFAHEFEVTGGWADPKVVKLTVAPVPNEAVNP